MTADRTLAERLQDPERYVDAIDDAIAALTTQQKEIDSLANMLALETLQDKAERQHAPDLRGALETWRRELLHTHPDVAHTLGMLLVSQAREKR